MICHLAAAVLPVLCIKLSTIDDGRRLVVCHLARGATRCLDCLDDLHGFLISYFTKDNMFAVKPASHDRGNKEL